MRRRGLASALLAVGGLAMIVGVPLRWFSVSAPDGTTLSRTGLDYAGYDVIVTMVFGALLVVVAAGVATAQRWGQAAAVLVALLACLWGALVVIAAANPADGGTADVTISIGPGAWTVAGGALVALVGSVMGFRGRDGAVVARGMTTSV